MTIEGDQNDSASCGKTRAVDHQEMLADFGIFALNSEDLDSVLHRACELAILGLGEKIAKVIEQHEDGRLFLRTTVGFEVSDDDRWIEPGRGSSAGHALMTGTPTVSRDAASDPRFDRASPIADLDIKSVINVPIPEAFGGEGEWYGVIEVDSQDGQDFTKDQVAFLTTYANLIAAAIGRHKAQRDVRRLMNDKDHLLKELQHRIKNNLSVISALVRLQSRNAAHPETIEQLDRIAGRVETLQLVHEELYSQRATERIALQPYLEALVENLAAFNSADEHGITVVATIDDHTVDTDVAIPIGLIVNEAVANSFKYAFGESGGRIAVTLTVTDGVARLSVSDDGVGAPEGFEQSKGTGTAIISGLSAQLGGAPEWSRDAGTALVISFPTS